MEFRYSKHVDLIYHELASMKVDNASNCYSQQYINKISKEKLNSDYNIETTILNLQNYYNIIRVLAVEMGIMVFHRHLEYIYLAR